MKRLRNFILLLIYIITAVVLGVLQGCTYSATPSYTKSDAIYDNWRAEQRAITKRQLDYANSPAFKAKYGGTSIGDKYRANNPSVVGTTADPYMIIRQPNMGVPNATIGVRVYK